MDKKTLDFLARYNHGVNEKMNALIRTLSDDEWNRSLGGFFPSVRSLCSHIYIADFNWLKRFGALRDFRTLRNGIFQKELTYKETLFPSVGEYLEARPLLDGEITALAAETGEADLEKPLRYTDSSGRPAEKPFGGALLQMLNHETFTRGMISLYLELLGRENDFSSTLALM
jgi:uncharacterized damage-inducible protein DinB